MVIQPVACYYLAAVSQVIFPSHLQSMDCGPPGRTGEPVTPHVVVVLNHAIAHVTGHIMEDWSVQTVLTSAIKPVGRTLVPVSFCLLSCRSMLLDF